MNGSDDESVSLSSVANDEIAVNDYGNDLMGVAGVVHRDS